MNKNRRKQLEEIKERLSLVLSDLEEVRDDEQECFDNLPDSLQMAEKGETMENNIYTIETIIGNLDSAIEGFEEIE